MSAGALDEDGLAHLAVGAVEERLVGGGVRHVHCRSLAEGRVGREGAQLAWSLRQSSASAPLDVPPGGVGIAAVRLARARGLTAIGIARQKEQLQERHRLGF